MKYKLELKTDRPLYAYLASIGSKGGKTKGASKRRSPEHYKRLAQMKKKTTDL